MRWGLALLLSFFVLALPAQTAARFRQYTVDQGLAQNSVYDILQDGEGFLWLATQDGLSRFDGYNFVNFHPKQNDSTSLTHNSVRCLFMDSRHLLWIGTRGGLACYNPVSGKFRQYHHDPKKANTLSDDITLAVCEDRQGRIWAGTANEGITIIDVNTGKMSYLRHAEGVANSLCGDDVRGLLTDHLGRIWITTWLHGVDMYDPSTALFRHLGVEKGLVAYPKSRGAMCEDRSGKIWLGSWGRGVAVYDPVTNTAVLNDSIPGLSEAKLGMVWDIMQDKAGRLWFATAEQGLVCFDPEKKQNRYFRNDPDDPGSLSDNNTWCVTQDRSGLIWCGTWQSGLSMYDERLERFGRQTHHSRDSLSLPNNTIWGLSSNGKGEIWMGTGDGVFIYNPLTRRYRRPALAAGAAATALPPGANIQTISFDHSGRVWMGTAGAGPAYYDTSLKAFRKFEPYVYKEFASGSITHIICDSKGVTWIAGSDGLVRYDEAFDSFTVFTNNPSDSTSLSDFNINCLIEKDADHLWVGTNSFGICLFDKRTGKCKRYGKAASGLRSLSVTTMFIDSYGRLWVGTGGGGLHSFDEKTGSFTHFGEEEGLPNSVINGIAEGAPGELWISTNRGICRFFPAGREVKVFSVEDGLQGNEFNQNSVLRTADGKIWFGGTRGYNVFDPKAIKKNEAPARAVITSLSVLNKAYQAETSLTYTESLTLSYRDYFFSFEFAGLEFTNPARNQYRYMLEGFDKNWVETGTRRFVTYTNLDPGVYTFRVSASNSDGVWSEAATSIRLVITPPFWRTTWFYILCGLTVVLTVWLYIRWRERRLRRDKNKLEEKVKARTYELQEEKEKVESAHKDIRDSINYARRIQDAILPQEEEFNRLFPESFVLYMPRDVVSGDFYWAAKLGEGADEKLLLAVADCTGHGVPGALMSMIGHALLNEIVKQEQVHEPAKILERLHLEVRAALKQGSGNETRDGMDIALVCYEPGKRRLQYAGANRHLVYFTGGGMQEIKPDKQAIGGLQDDAPRRFTPHTVDLGQEGRAVFYLFSDGYADQFGGEKGKKFMLKRLHEMLAVNHHLPMKAQGEKLREAIVKWKGAYEQVDDMLVVGICI